MKAEALVGHDVVQMALAADRMLTYTGYVLLAGTLMFWTLVWPNGRTDQRQVALAATGTSLMALGAVGGPLIHLVLDGRAPDDLVGPRDGAALLVRLAALTAMAFFLTDVVKTAVVGWRRAFAWIVVAVIAGTLVAQSDAIGGSLQAIKIVATTGHVVATATWLGGLIALAAVLIPRENFEELDRLIPRFSRVAVFSVITLTLTGAVHALAVAGGVSQLVTSRYGLVLLVKVALFALMLLLGNHGRNYTSQVVRRMQHESTAEVRAGSGAHTLAVVMGAELTLAFVVLATTSILVAVAPGA